MSRDFEIVESSRGLPIEKKERHNKDNGNPVLNAVADNFGQIIDLAYDLVEIEKVKVQSAAIVANMEATRKQLIAETDAYVSRKNADTNAIVSKMVVVREMMKDFYQYDGGKNLSSDDFSKIIMETLAKIGLQDE